MALIRAIDKTTVNRICSGQVVLNFATAVKELLENSIDAGASSIQIKLKEYGSDLVEISDDGCGVEEGNFQALTLKHHTSKITEFEDLYNVETFGFRGEALSSLCSVSDVTIITQHKNAIIGAMLKFDHNGIITSNVKTLRKVGTTVRLENLFSTLPIRRTEFVKNLKREFSKMCNVLYAYGLNITGVRITCTNHVSKSKLTTKETQEEKVKRSKIITIMDTKGDSVESNIISIFGVKQKQNLLRITEALPSQEILNEFGLLNKNLQLDKFKLDGYISSCDHGCGRTTSDRQFYYINSRPTDNTKISKLVNDVYHQYNNQQDPFVVLNIKVACGSCDMNITPDKRQILLQNERLLLAVLKESLLKIFKNIPSVLKIKNVELSKMFSKSNDMSVTPQALEKFKKSMSGQSIRNENKEQIESRIHNLLKLRIHSRNPQKDSKNSVNHSNLLNNFGVKPEIDDDIITITTGESSESSRPEILIHSNRGGDETRKLSNLPDEKEMGYGSVEYHECKRKNEGVEEKEQDSKRMKLDEGLGEEHKKKRKCVPLSITVADIKRKSLKIKEDEKVEGTREVKFLSEIKPQSNERAVNELKREIKKESFKQMEIIGQFNLGFIITKLDCDIFIIDQHASDEKYNFETLQSNTVMQSQKLFNPEKLELPVDREELMMAHRDIFRDNGFDFVFEKNGPPTKRISLIAIPFSKNTVFGKEDVDELLFFLENAPELKKLRPSRVQSMFASRACRKSVMIGTPLNVQEMRRIVDHMGEIEQPWNCPHGRPTMRHLLNLHIIGLGN